ncbi:hypothetical protein UA08_01924 [Talaromyces atroroseus]|uniref:Uncharacterized protein n=1 Tax=Talaromyces atroroseus TaxID=1441469 RepID=A0A1Q5QBQ0_TALAT|nr:hypothetical protein UA08_01924 [Talaromyces atroroseus]OKL63372.1 hypothetical protein UA08_01924 [Talaromyces atroroseus]
MDKSFLFVDSTHVDSTTRKSIRRHVMNGKNVGKTHRRSSRFDLVRRTPYNYDNRTFGRSPRASAENATNAIQSVPCPVANHKNLGNSLLSLSFPMELTSHSLKVINEHFIYVMDKLYPCQLGLSADESKYTWLRVLLTDDAAFLCTMALLEATNELFLRGGVSSTNALRHLSRSLALLKRRLESENAMSDSTLAIIITLILHEQIRNGLRECKIHYEGLKQLIELRGGLDQFERNLTLVLKICK